MVPTAVHSYELLNDMNGTTKGVEIENVADLSLQAPVAIEGLPGVGNVGKIVVDHILAEAESTLVRRLFSEHFPPQVTLDADGTATLPMTEIHAVELDDIQLLLITGDHQAVTAVGHYRITAAILDILETFDVAEVYAIGGMPTGETVEEHAVVGAVSDADLREPLEATGVEFREGEPAGGVVGISGLLLGLGGQRDLPVSCLMGETSGYVVDPNSASAVLSVIEERLGFEFSHDRLEEQAEKIEGVIQTLQENQMAQNTLSHDDGLRYID